MCDFFHQDLILYIDDNILTINKSLIKLAYIMQNVGKSSINSQELAQIIPNSAERNNIKLSGIFEKNEEMNWKFSHKNFQDYYAAWQVLKVI